MAAEPLLIARAGPGSDGPDAELLPAMANRHLLIAGATGTGKTVTVQRLVEQFSRQGVPVLLTEIKGDLSGLACSGPADPRFSERRRLLDLPPPDGVGCPAEFWDVFGEQGHPLRATVSELGPLLLARLLDLNATQTGVIQLAFRVADDEGLLVLDLKDLRELLRHLSANARAYQDTYGSVSAASVGAIQRSLLALEEQHADRFFGEPALQLNDLLQSDPQGRGLVHVLAAGQLHRSPKLYATVLLWLLSSLYDQLPEVGDGERPRLLLVFDEAHLLFDGAPAVLVDTIEQVVRLIRSKGVALLFCTQNPTDLPDRVLSQIANRVQHALRAFTPAEQKRVKAAASAFRASPGLDVVQAIGELGVGEALVSCLDAAGVPQPVQRGLVVPPDAPVGTIAPEERQRRLDASPLQTAYRTPVDRDSAYERLQQRAERSAGLAAASREQAQQQRQEERAREQARRQAERERQRLLLSLAGEAGQRLGGRTGRSIARGLMGGLLGRGS